MKYRTSIFIAIIILVVLYPFPEITGVYIKVSGLIWCKNKNACIHEIAHKIDDENGWVSHTNQFKETVELYAGYEIDRGFLNKNLEEIYADIFENSGGVSENMPELLRPYYDWDRAKELMKHYEVNDA